MFCVCVRFRFVFSNMTMLLSKLLHSTADQPVADWEDKVRRREGEEKEGD